MYDEEFDMDTDDDNYPWMLALSAGESPHSAYPGACEEAGMVGVYVEGDELLDPQWPDWAG